MAWQLGWLTLLELSGASLAPGQTLSLRLASQAASPRSGLRVVQDWTAQPAEPIFAGLRTAAGGDAGLPPGAAGKVHIYSSAIANTYDAQPTTQLASLAGGGGVAGAQPAGLLERGGHLLPEAPSP